MIYEVEQKFPVDDFAALESQLAGLGVGTDGPLVQIDTYYAHPARDFAESDEALRIRRVGQANFLTYKGPKIDATTKTRREIEIPLPDGASAAAEAADLFEALGFSEVTKVRKTRRPFTVAWEGFQVAGGLDEVDRLGTFVELEITAGPSDLASAKAALASLATRLGLVKSERRSYMELLLGSQ